jgi:hypothetical protein
MQARPCAMLDGILDDVLERLPEAHGITVQQHRIGGRVKGYHDIAVERDRNCTCQCFARQHGCIDFRPPNRFGAVADHRIAQQLVGQAR